MGVANGLGRGLGPPLCNGLQQIVPKRWKTTDGGFESVASLDEGREGKGRLPGIAPKAESHWPPHIIEKRCPGRIRPKKKLARQWTGCHSVAIATLWDRPEPQC